MAAIDAPIALEPQRATANWTVFPSFLPLPGMGVLAVNSFLLKDREPLLVDTGMAPLGDDFLAALEAEIDLDDLRWIWLSHADADHIGNLARVLERAPNARVITTFLGFGKMSLMGFDAARIDLLEPGQRVELGSRTLIPLRPPYYDAPESLGFLDTKDGALFVVDAFGALLSEPLRELAAVAEDTLRDGLVAWSAIDAPWLGTADRTRFAATLAAVRGIAPEVILSGHLPPARGAAGRLTALVEEAWCADRLPAGDPLALDQFAAAVAA